MKILFSVYSEDLDTEMRQLLFSDIIETEMTVPEIDNLLEIYDLFWSNLEVGQNLAFWDIFCFGEFEQELIDKIRMIPLAKTEVVTTAEPTILRIQEYDPGNTDSAFYPDIRKCYFYKISRYERGASSFGAIIALIQNDPILAGVVGSAIFETGKYLLSKLWKILFKKSDPQIFRSRRRTLYLRAKRFYVNFQKMTNINRDQCQIVGLERTRGGKLKVRVRTLHDGAYEIIATAKGKIEKLTLIDITASEV
ncbi:MAG: hypothetical protein IKB04_00960 [Clostridia bacterium]|nr:hypothetical protein [Clostridia bacterium]